MHRIIAQMVVNTSIRTPRLEVSFATRKNNAMYPHAVRTYQYHHCIVIRLPESSHSLWK